VRQSEYFTYFKTSLDIKLQLLQNHDRHCFLFLYRKFQNTGEIVSYIFFKITLVCVLIKMFYYSISFKETNC